MLKNPTKCLALGARGSPTLCSTPSLICLHIMCCRILSYITEILLHVTLNNQSLFLSNRGTDVFGGQLWRQNDIIMKRGLSLTSFWGKTLCVVPLDIQCACTNVFCQSRSYPEMVNMNWFFFPKLSQQTPYAPDKSGEICFGLVKYFNFFLINVFKFLKKYKNVW